MKTNSNKIATFLEKLCLAIKTNNRKPIGRKKFFLFQILIWIAGFLILKAFQENVINLRELIIIFLGINVIEIPLNLGRLSSANLTKWIEWSRVLLVANVALRLYLKELEVVIILMSLISMVKLPMLLAPQRRKKSEGFTSKAEKKC